MTITIYILPTDLAFAMQNLITLEKLSLDNNYVLSKHTLTYSDTFVSNYVAVNLPFETYLKLKQALNR